MRRYLYTFAAALLVGLGLGFWLWYSPAPSPDRVAGILIATPRGKLDVDKVERVRAREGDRLTFVVVNASDVARTVALGFFRNRTPVNLCDEAIPQFRVDSQRFATVTCRVGRGIVDRFPQDPTDEDERTDPNVRAFDYRLSFDGETYYDPRLVIQR
jgi:hypothetical protein